MPRRHYFFTLVMLTVASASLIAAGVFRTRGHPVFAQTTASVAFSPPSPIYALSVTPVPTIDVTVANVSGLAGYEVWISYNSSVVRLNSLTDSGFLANQAQNVVVCDGPTITPGYGYLACSILPALTPVLPLAGATPAPLVHAAFEPLTSGASPLSLTAVVSGTPETTTLLNIDNTPVAASLGSGSITITGASVGGVAQLPEVTASRATGTGSGADLNLPGVAAIAACIALAVGAAVWRLAQRRH